MDRMGRARLLADQGLVIEAMADLGRLLKRSGPHPELFALRAQFGLQCRNYESAEADINQAVALAPTHTALRAKRAEFFVMTNRLDKALEDLGSALRLSPQDVQLRLARLRVFLQNGDLRQARADIQRLSRSRSPRIRSEADFYQGYLDLKSARPQPARRAFLKVLKAWPASDHLSLRARFYWVASRAADVKFGRRQNMERVPAKSPKLYLCGLGIFPPYTATLEVLHALSLCDVVFNNVAGPETRELLAEFCADIRTSAYQAAEDEGRWTERIFTVLREGKSVGFVTRGHPLVFGQLACELVRRCRSESVALESFGSVSSIDHILAYTGKGLGADFSGIQAFDWKTVSESASLNGASPLLVCFYEGISKRQQVSELKTALKRYYPASHECWMFGPKYDAAPAVLKISELDGRYPRIHSSLMLYVPPQAGAVRKARPC